MDPCWLIALYLANVRCASRGGSVHRIRLTIRGVSPRGQGTLNQMTKKALCRRGCARSGSRSYASNEEPDSVPLNLRTIIYRIQNGQELPNPNRIMGISAINRILKTIDLPSLGRVGIPDREPPRSPCLARFPFRSRSRPTRHPVCDDDVLRRWRCRSVRYLPPVT
jgi:hypothetical protein